MSGDAPAIDFSGELIKEERTLTSGDGQTTLTWEIPGGARSIELQQGATREFVDPVVRYRGLDPGSVLTGLPEGSHYFRIRAVGADDQPGPWSAPFEVKVHFMERARVVSLLIIGGLIVLTTAGAIVTGYIRKEATA